MSPHSGLAWGLCLTTALAASCAKPFPPSDELTSTRILAIQSEPIDLAVDAGVTLTALIYVPGGAAPASPAWSWCPSLGSAADNYACTLTAAELDTRLSSDGGLSFNYDLGTGSSVAFAYPAAPDQLGNLCGAAGFGNFDAGTDGGTVDGGANDGGASDGGVLPDGGVEDAGPPPSCTLSMDVLLDLDAGVAVRAFRTLSVLVNTAATANTNPTVTGANAATDAGATPGVLSYATTYALTAQVPLSSSDSYWVSVPAFFLGPDGGFQRDLDAGSPRDGGERPDAGTATDAGDTYFPDGGVSSDEQERFEGLSLAWYVEAGTLGQATTSISDVAAVDGGDPRDWTPLLTNTWTAPAGGSGAPTSVELILVIRDTRDGVGWITTQLSLGNGAQP